MFYLICVLINLVMVSIDIIHDLFDTGKIRMKRGNLAMLAVLVLAGFTGTILLIGIVLMNKVPEFKRWTDKDVVLYKDDFWEQFL